MFATYRQYWSAWNLYFSLATLNCWHIPFVFWISDILLTTMARGSKILLIAECLITRLLILQCRGAAYALTSITKTMTKTHITVKNVDICQGYSSVAFIVSYQSQESAASTCHANKAKEVYKIKQIKQLKKVESEGPAECSQCLATLTWS